MPQAGVHCYVNSVPPVNETNAITRVNCSIVIVHVLCIELLGKLLIWILCKFQRRNEGLKEKVSLIGHEI